MLRLLQTQYCSQALEVMDHIMTMSETPMSKQHMRMSFVGSGSRATRKEHDRIQRLYGIPEETRWSIPMPAVHTNNTRANMQAVYLAGIHLQYLGETPLKRLDILQDSPASPDEATPVEAIQGSRLDAGQERPSSCLQLPIWPSCSSSMVTNRAGCPSKSAQLLVRFLQSVALPT